jgi:MYXO-CTERM domain-containing protein
MSPFSAKTPTARKGSLKPAQITSYLAGAVGTVALIGAPQAEAAVTAVTFGFGTDYNISDGSNNWSVGSFGFLQGTANSIRLALGGSDGQVYENQSYDVNNGLPTFFNYGDILGNSTQGNKFTAFFKAEHATLNFTSDQTNQLIGFKTSTNNFGWANVTYTVSTSNLHINSAYVQSVANTAITIGAIPEPSRALLALAGLGGIALRRRRKQAA